MDLVVIPDVRGLAGSGDASMVATGLGVSAAVSIAMGAVYVARLTAPFSPSPKEIPALGLLVALAGKFCVFFAYLWFFVSINGYSTIFIIIAPLVV